MAWVVLDRSTGWGRVYSGFEAVEEVKRTDKTITFKSPYWDRLTRANLSDVLAEGLTEEAAKLLLERLRSSAALATQECRESDARHQARVLALLGRE